MVDQLLAERFDPLRAAAAKLRDQLVKRDLELARCLAGVLLEPQEVSLRELEVFLFRLIGGSPLSSIGGLDRVEAPTGACPV